MFLWVINLNYVAIYISVLANLRYNFFYYTLGVHHSNHGYQHKVTPQTYKYDEEGGIGLRGCLVVVERMFNVCNGGIQECRDCV